MLGCDNVAVARASRRKRSRRSGSPTTASASTLIATVRPSRVSRARYTAIPPAPIRSRIRYCARVSSNGDDYTDRRVNVYFALLRSNRNFRLLYIGQTISQLGDWFNAVAVYALLLDLTGSATAVAWMMITQFLPIALVGPVAGVVVDRVNRRRLMIGADAVRGVLILGLLFVRHADQVWMAYVVMALTSAASGFFEPSR